MKTKHSLILAAIVLLAGCSVPHPGPDKTIEGTAVGAAWGAGVGTVVGNQVTRAALGTGVGAGFGAAAGLLHGVAYDRMEESMLKEQRELDALSMRTHANFEKLAEIQDTLDEKNTESSLSGIYQVFFDDDSTTLKSGSVANIQVIAESIKASTGARNIYVVGHTDDAGNPEYNKRLAEARAREVAGYLGSRGISMDQIKVSSYGSQHPIASNTTPEGRQLNRRVDIYIGQ